MGHTRMKSALANEQTRVLIGCVSVTVTRGRGSKILKVLQTSFKYMAPYGKGVDCRRTPKLTYLLTYGCLSESFLSTFTHINVKLIFRYRRGHYCIDAKCFECRMHHLLACQALIVQNILESCNNLSPSGPCSTLPRIARPDGLPR